MQLAPMGNGLDESSVLGPLQNEQQFDVVNCLVESAKSSRARVLMEATHPSISLDNYPPPLLPASTRTIPGSRKSSSVPPCPSLATPQRTRQSPWPTDLKWVWQPRSGLRTWPLPATWPRVSRAGTVWINKHGAVDPRIPFGGAKQSGCGLEFGVEGLKALGVRQVING